MQQIVYTKKGVELQNNPKPTPKADEALIHVKAAGLNFADILARQGLYQDAPKRPCVMGYEVSGIIEAKGEAFDAFDIGDEVIGLCRFNGQSEYICLKKEHIFKKPEKLSFEQAAAIPVNYITAWGLIVAMGGLTKDEHILIHNAGSGVGLAAIQIANHIGAQIIGTASEYKHAFLKKKNCHHVVNYREKSWDSKVLEITVGNGVELILDPIGGPNWAKNLQLLRHTGRLGVYGVSGLTGLTGFKKIVTLLKLVLIDMPKRNLIELMHANNGIFGLNLGRLWHEPEKAAIWMGEILKGVEDGWVEPHIAKVFEFKNVLEAHKFVEERKNIGKVILVP